MTTATASPELATAVGRSACYEFLALGFAFPTDRGEARITEHLAPVLAGLESGDSELDRLLALALEARRLPLAQLRELHGELFTHIEPMDHPPYESAFVGSEIFRQTEVMADVAGFYRAHGLKVGGRERERPDHIVTELEFMAFMATKEAYALQHLDEASVEECRRTQDHFLADHLGCWAPGFARRVAVMAQDAVFRAHARALEAWIMADLRACDLTPVEVLEDPSPQLPPDDDSCGAGEMCGVEVTPAGGDAGTPVELGRSR
ncbi:MAG: molecular chaperone TorD family protein [Acidimicrobiia bacterium]